MTLDTDDCIAKCLTGSIVKFTDDTTVTGLITNNTVVAYRDEVRNINMWCHWNNLSLIEDITKELITGFRRSKKQYKEPFSSSRLLSIFYFQASIFIHTFFTFFVVSSKSRLNLLKVLKNFSVLTKTQKLLNPDGLDVRRHCLATLWSYTSDEYDQNSIYSHLELCKRWLYHLHRWPVTQHTLYSSLFR